MWLYNGKELLEEEIPEKSIGFIYIIKQKSTGKRYIGKKLLTKAATKTTNGKKKKIRKPSDWKTYWSSSPHLKELIASVGEGDFTREVIQFVSSKGMLAYAEEFCLYSLGALESDDWFNNNIRSKVYRSWVVADEATQLRSKLKTI